MALKMDKDTQHSAMEDAIGARDSSAFRFGCYHDSLAPIHREQHFGGGEGKSGCRRPHIDTQVFFARTRSRIPIDSLGRVVEGLRK